MATVGDDLQPCRGCQDAIELDQVTLITFDGAEFAVLACDYHTRRQVLALVVLDALQQVEQIEIPPLVDVAYKAHVQAEPERRS
jgi:hypothetical protein